MILQCIAFLPVFFHIHHAHTSLSAVEGNRAEQKRKRDPHAAEHINENAMESKQTLSVPACRLLKFLFVQDIKTMVCAWFLKSKYPL